MLKKLIRLTTALIFGSLILMNSLAYSSGSVRAEESRGGSVYTSPSGAVMVICDGGLELGCPPIQDQQ